jgi:hypothetical protein
VSTRAILTSTKWARALPVLALAITVVLMITAAAQDEKLWADLGHGRFPDTPNVYQVPARLLMQLLSGPSFLFRVWFGGFHAFGLYFADLGCLPFVALFWFWVGWGLDRRIAGNRAPWIKSRLFRGMLYGAMLTLTCLFGWAVLHSLKLQSLLPPSSMAWRTLKILKLRSHALGEYAMLLWTMLFIFYFARKFVVALNLPNASPAQADVSLTRTERIIWLCLSFELIALLISIVR